MVLYIEMEIYWLISLCWNILCVPLVLNPYHSDLNTDSPSYDKKRLYWQTKVVRKDRTLQSLTIVWKSPARWFASFHSLSHIIIVSIMQSIFIMFYFIIFYNGKMPNRADFLLPKSGLHCRKQLVTVGASLGHQVGAGSFLASVYSNRVLNLLDFYLLQPPWQ